jgi:transcriptional regulator with XRE-family HTH domain
MPNNWSKNFGLLIQQCRLKQNLPLRKIAAELDIDTSTLSKIEKGERQASLKMIPIVAKLFNIDFKELQVKTLSEKLIQEYGKEKHIIEVLEMCLNSLKVKQK